MKKGENILLVTLPFGERTNCKSIGTLTEDEHIVTLDSHISRRNCFGDVHNADEKYYWLGPAAWVTTGAMWTYEYRLRRTGMISSPILTA